MKLFVIILNWNGKNDTLACLSSIEQAKTPPDHIIVVDNGSTDDSVIEISKRFPKITLLSTGQNLGYAGGNNVGIQYALEKGADLVLLLNNDTIVDRHFFSALQNSASQSPDTAIFGAYPLLMSDPQKIDHLGGVWNRAKGAFDLIGTQSPDGFRTDAPLGYVCGCSILIRRKVFEKIGLLEPTFFLFWEEADFCQRAKAAGFCIGISYEARLTHKVSASFTGAPHKKYFFWRGRFLYIERNCTDEEKKRLNRTTLLPELRHILKLKILNTLQLSFLTLLRHPKASKKKLQLLQYRAALQGYRDFRAKKFGPGPAWLHSKKH